MLRRIALTTTILASLAGCPSPSTNGPATPEAGTEGSACYSNSTCDDGLICLSDLCVDAGEGDGDGEGEGECEGEGNGRAIIRLEPELGGPRCPFSGTRVLAGVDDNNDGILTGEKPGEEEVDDEDVICTSEPGPCASGFAADVAGRCLPENPWQLVFSGNFDDGTLNGITSCLGCSGLGCPAPAQGGIFLGSDWSILCIPNSTTSDAVDFRVEFEITQLGQLEALFGIDRLSIPQVNFGATASACVLESGEQSTEIVPAWSIASGVWAIEKSSGVYSLISPSGTILQSQPCELGDGPFSLALHAPASVRANAVVDNIRWFER
jgi:hypothetical protein